MVIEDHIHAEGSVVPVHPKGVFHPEIARSVRENRSMALVSDYRFNDDVLKKFWDRVEVRGPDECWLYTGRLVNGYGLFAVRRWKDREKPKPSDGSRAYWGALLAHRIALWSLAGQEPGESVDHICHTNDPFCVSNDECVHRRCCNPAHLEPVSAAENARRRKGRVKDACIYGHPMVGDNVYRSPTGARACRTCVQRRNDENNAKQKAWRAANPPQPTQVECPECLLPFMREPGSARKYCSDDCAGEANRRSARDRGRRVRLEDPEGVRQYHRDYYRQKTGDPIERAERALAILCPQCGADPDKACLNRKYRPTPKIHQERYDASDPLQYAGNGADDSA